MIKTRRGISTYLSIIVLVAVIAIGAIGQITNQPGQVNPVNLQQPTVTGPAGNVTSPSGTLVNVSPGPLYCYGKIFQLDRVQFNLLASTTYYIVAECGSGRVMARTNFPPLPTDVPIATVLVGATTVTTITDNRSVINFPTVTDWYEWVPAMGHCGGTVSGNGSGTQGITMAGSTSLPMVQDSTNATGTNTHSYVCSIPLPSRTTTGKGVVSVANVYLAYGVGTNALGTQSSGNFTYGTLTLPTGSGQTGSGTFVSGGSVTLFPVTGSFNTGSVAAGTFYTEEIIFNTPMVLNTDFQVNEFSATFVLSATTATITNVAGYFVHYTNVNQ